MKRAAASTSGAGHDHGTRRNPPQSRAVASPSPVPLSWSIPDHLSHLTPLLPTPSPVGVSVNVGADVRVVEKGVRVRWPGKRTTIGEMRRRVRGMMEFVARAQLEAGERDRRAGMLRAAMEEAGAAFRAEALSHPPIRPGTLELEHDVTMADGDIDTAVDVKPITREEVTTDIPGGSIPKLEEAESSSMGKSPFAALDQIPHTSAPITPAEAYPTNHLPPLPSQFLPPISTTPTIFNTTHSVEATPITPVPAPIPTPPPQISTTQLLDELTRELIQFQERFGAAKEGKVYRDRTDRERRTRGSGVMAQGDSGGY